MTMFIDKDEKEQCKALGVHNKYVQKIIIY